jgi:hypothetical protein
VKVAKYGSNLDLRLRSKGGKTSAALLRLRLKGSYDRYWSIFSAKGGVSALSSKTSLLRRSVGPLGERMFNALEVDVAKCLLSRGIAYVYEPKLVAERGVLFPDFLTQTHVIECTAWTDTRAKSRALRERFGRIRPSLPHHSFLVVTTDRLVQNYRSGLGSEIGVLTLADFGRSLNPIGIPR